jgi:hypothetical protein
VVDEVEAVQAALDHSKLATTSVYLRQLEGQEDPDHLIVTGQDARNRSSRF